MSKLLFKFALFDDFVGYSSTLNKEVLANSFEKAFPIIGKREFSSTGEIYSYYYVTTGMLSDLKTVIGMVEEFGEKFKNALLSRRELEFLTKFTTESPETYTEMRNLLINNPVGAHIKDELCTEMTVKEHVSRYGPAIFRYMKRFPKLITEDVKLAAVYNAPELAYLLTVVPDEILDVLGSDSIIKCNLTESQEYRIRYMPSKYSSQYDRLSDNFLRENFAKIVYAKNFYHEKYRSNKVVIYEMLKIFGTFTYDQIVYNFNVLDLRPSKELLELIYILKNA